MAIRHIGTILFCFVFFFYRSELKELPMKIVLWPHILKSKIVASPLNTLFLHMCTCSFPIRSGWNTNVALCTVVARGGAFWIPRFTKKKFLVQGRIYKFTTCRPVKNWYKFWWPKKKIIIITFRKYSPTYQVTVTKRLVK